MEVKNTQELFFELLQIALGNRECLSRGLSAEEWEQIYNLSQEQAIFGVMLEGIQRLPQDQLPPKLLLLQWIGETEQQSFQYEHAWAVARKLDKLWASAGIHALVLKGRTIAQYYPIPSHRYSCDLDVFIKQGWKQACEMLESKGLQLEYEVYKEAEFRLDNIYVECHRYITPLRGNKHLQKVERYLYSLLDSEPKKCFEGTTLACPPLEFILILYVEHALGDLQQGKLLLKHILDWVILRKQSFHRQTFERRCKEFKFDRVVALIDALADVMEGLKTYESLQPSFQRVYDEIFSLRNEAKPAGNRSWFRKRVALFFKIMKNNRNFRDFSYTSMTQYLFGTVWSHFFDKEVEI